MNLKATINKDPGGRKPTKRNELFLYMYNHAREHGTIPTQSQMAKALNSYPPVICRIMAKLKEDNYIKVEGDQIVFLKTPHNENT